MKIWPWFKIKVKELEGTIICMKFEVWRSNSLCSIVKSLMWPWEWKFDLGSRSWWKSWAEALFNYVNFKISKYRTKSVYDLENENLTLGQGEGERAGPKHYIYKIWALKVNSLCSIGKSLMWPWEWKFDLGLRSRWKSLTEQLCVWSLNSIGQIVFVL